MWQFLLVILVKLSLSRNKETGIINIINFDEFAMGRGDIIKLYIKQLLIIKLIILKKIYNTKY